MAKVKGIKKLNKALKKAFKPFGDINMRLAADYGYYPTDDTIEYRLTEGHIEDIWFNQFVKERFGYKVKNTFMFSILHEIGHYYTIKEIRDCDIMFFFCEDEKYRIQTEMNTAKNERQCKKLEWQYFNLPDEIAATAWAVNYARENAEEVEAIWQNVLKAIHKFYAKNITEEG